MSGNSPGMDEAALRRLLASGEMQALVQRLRGPGGTAPDSAAALERALGPQAVARLEQDSGLPASSWLPALAALLPSLGAPPAAGGSDIPGHAGPGFGYGGAPPGQERDPKG